MIDVSLDMLSGDEFLVAVFNDDHGRMIRYRHFQAGKRFLVAVDVQK